MEDKNLNMIEPQQDNIPCDLLEYVIDEYGLESLVGVGLFSLLGAAIGGIVGIKIYIKK